MTTVDDRPVYALKTAPAVLNSYAGGRSRRRAKCRRDQAFTAQTARQAVNTLYEECGGSGLFESSDLQRLWRDANAAAAHRGLTGDWIYAAWAKTQLGVQPDPGFLF